MSTVALSAKARSGSQDLAVGPHPTPCGRAFSSVGTRDRAGHRTSASFPRIHPQRFTPRIAPQALSPIHGLGISRRDTESAERVAGNDNQNSPTGDCPDSQPNVVSPRLSVSAGACPRFQ